MSDNSTQAYHRQGRTVRKILLRVLEGPDRDVSFVIESGEVVAVGLAADNAVRLTDTTVSRYHLEIAATKEGARIRDLGSLNGTFVDTVRVETAVVAPGT